MEDVSYKQRAKPPQSSVIMDSVVKIQFGLQKEVRIQGQKGFKKVMVFVPAKEIYPEEGVKIDKVELKYFLSSKGDRRFPEKIRMLHQETGPPPSQHFEGIK